MLSVLSSHLALLLPASRCSRIQMAASRPQADAQKWIEEHHGAVSKSQGMGGSGWASFCHVTTAEREFFVKTSTKNCEPMFHGEAVGLRAMHVTNTIRIPEVLHFGDSESGAGSFIIMDFLPLSGRADQRLFGRRMAEMHLATPAAAEARAGKFGFGVTNTCGGTPQPNAWRDDWVDFFLEQRIGHQLRTAGDTALRDEWRRVCRATDDLRALFDGVEVRPSVLHGAPAVLVERWPCGRTTGAPQVQLVLVTPHVSNLPSSRRPVERQRRGGRRRAVHLRPSHLLRPPRGAHAWGWGG